MLVAVICGYLTARRYFLFAATQLHICHLTQLHMPFPSCTMHAGNHVDLVKPALSERERKRQGALEEKKHKAVAGCACLLGGRWYELTQAMAHGWGEAKGSHG